MNAWLYARLSNDDDPEMDSLANQMEICKEFALGQGYSIAGSSFDDNVSGMKFNRRGLDMLTDAVEAGQVDAIIVKDLSRLGRHRIQTALFIDYLRQKNVAVISVTENLNTLEEQDDLIVGIRGLMNDFYARDIGNKIRHGYREKQKAGLVITPPFGYRKDRNTNCIYIHPEAAETVRLIYELYLQGCGQKEIARRLNRLGRKTPAQLQAERYGKDYYAVRKSAEGKYIWDYASVKNILTDESYAGVLTNHKREIHSGKSKPVDAENQFRHEDFFPAVISQEDWNTVQILLKANARSAPGNKPSHRYAGLLQCGGRGSVFVPMIRYWNGNRRVEYVCRSYHRGGKAICSSHRIHEEAIDQQVTEQLAEQKRSWEHEQLVLSCLRRDLDKKMPGIQRQVAQLRQEIAENEEEIDELLLMKAMINRR